jgi:uncharacterized cysteine cluster protein YcgN (CxxCxxCC family)
MMAYFKIGDRVWRPAWDSTDNYVTCPDCGGTGRLRVTFHDETTVSIECRNCSVGYDPPTGRVRCYDRRPKAEPMTITGMEVNAAGVKYQCGTTTCYYSVEEADVFATHDEAFTRAQEMAAAADAAERARILTKEKDTRSWAWNASYHRARIKEAQRQLDYHTAKLNVAALKAKESA